jgi:hypothetical protein
VRETISLRQVQADDKKDIMKIVKRVVLAIFLIGFAIMGYFYFGTYSEGVRQVLS